MASNVKPLKLLLLIDSLGSGGAQRQLVNLAIGLKQRGHAVSVFIYYPEFDYFRNQLVAAKIPIIANPKKTRYELGVIRGINRFVNSNEPDWIISFLETPSLYAAISKNFKSRPRLLISERSSNPNGKLSATQKIKRQTYRFATHITTNSHFQLDILKSELPWLKNKSSVIYNGIQHDFFELSESTPRPPEDRLNLVALGKLCQQKNYQTLIDAMVHLKRTNRKVPIVHWIGKLFPEEQRRYQDKLSLLKSHQLDSLWQWHGEQSSVIPFLSKADALIQPSFYEGLSNSICESMAAARPVLASNVCENPILINNRGMLFNPNSSISIADCIASFQAKTPNEKIEIGANCREFAMTNFTQLAFVNAYDKILLEQSTR